MTISIMTAEDYDIEVLDLLEIDPFKLILFGKSIFHILCIQNEVSSVQKIIDFSIKNISKKGSRRLSQRIKQYSLLMKDLNIPETFYSNTAVHLAIINNCREVLECLLMYNIDLQ